MEKLSGYARVILCTRVNQEVNKPFIGKPYLKCGQCLGLWAYFFQLGGILGAKHRLSLDAFGNAFLGATGEPGAVERFFTALANDLVRHSISDSITFGDYVNREFRRRLGYAGDPARFFVEHGMDKIPPETAAELAWQYADQGAALGSIYPSILREVFERSHTVVSTEQWDRARAAGLNIPSAQTLMSYEDTEEGENGVFMAYCRECCPDLYAILSNPPVGAEQHRTKSEILELDMRPDYLEVGLDISWADIVRQVFRVLEFERVGTTIGPNDEVRPLSEVRPYGYLVVESPVLDELARLPIVHRDDFLLAASVFDEPKLVDLINDQELLVTYAPKKVLPMGLAGDSSHVLHYVITASGALDGYYANDAHMANPAPEKLLGAFVYGGEIKVGFNLEPEL